MSSLTTTTHAVGQLAHSPAVLTWSGWSQVPGGLQTDQAVGMDAAIPSLYGTDMNTHRIYVNDHGYSGNWSDHWSEVPGGGTTDQALTATWVGGFLYLFAKGMDRKVYLNVLNGRIDPPRWNASWSEVPGGMLTDTTLAATSWYANKSRLYLFARGQDNTIRVNVFEQSSTDDGSGA
jgi:hypothetical protein